jgi:hypothetical protein
MRLTRRNALIGLGTVAAGAGVVGGSGAFTSVTAERTVSVETAGDGSAALQLTDAGGENDEYVTQPSDGTVGINLDGSNTDTAALNQNAVTRLENLVQVANNGTQTVTSLSLEFADDDDNADVSAFSFTATKDGTTKDFANGDDILSDDDDGFSGDLETGDANLFFGIVVDLINNSVPDSNTDYTLTITAETS